MSSSEDNNEFIDIETIENFIENNGFLMKSEALFYSIELAFELKNKGYSPKQFLDIKTGSDYSNHIHWGSAIEIYANYLCRTHRQGNGSIH